MILAQSCLQSGQACRKRRCLVTYKVHKGLTGKRWVAYACEHCQSPLESPIEEAGTTQNCPTCGSKLLVPGQAERKAIEQERQRMTAEQARIAAERERQHTALDQHVAGAIHEQSSSEHLASGTPEMVNGAARTQTEDDISYRRSVQEGRDGDLGNVPCVTTCSKRGHLGTSPVRGRHGDAETRRRGETGQARTSSMRRAVSSLTRIPLAAAFSST